MEFDKVILDLYFSNDKYKIQRIINKSFHRKECPFIADETIEAIHTGIYFNSQNKKIMELLYCINMKEFIYQKSQHHEVTPYCPLLGEVMHWCLTQYNGDDYGHFASYDDSKSYHFFKYCSNYDISFKSFAQPFQELPIKYRTIGIPFELKGKCIIKNGRKYIGTYCIGTYKK